MNPLNSTYDEIVALLVALVLPFIVIKIRNNLRRERYSLVQEIEQAFGFQSDTSPSFEFVKSKYDGRNQQFSAWKIYLSAIPYMALSAIGIAIIFTPLAQVITRDESKAVPAILLLADGITCWPDGCNGATGENPARPASPVTSPGTASDPGQQTTTNPPLIPRPQPCTYGTTACQMMHSLTVVGFAFAGAILFSLSYLLRAVTNFELGPQTFLRVTTNMLFAVVCVVALWRIAPAVPSLAPLSGVWYGIAFLIGFLPDLGLRLLVSKLSLPLKGYRSDLLEKAPVVPLELIDGIDSATAFRLQDQQIFDVQNLATFNPIMLHVETPFGFYESIDWVAQAQLCTIVGADGFIALRSRNIRTIFDLERATIDPRATATLRRDLAQVIFKWSSERFSETDERPTNTGPALRTRIDVGAGGAPPDPAQVDPVPDNAGPANPAPANPTPANPAPANPAPAPASASPPISRFTDDDLIHLFEVMVDDLHVHRLRQIWELVGTRLGSRYTHLTPVTSAQQT